MGNWARGLDTVELHAYSVSFEPIPKDRDYVNFGLFLEADLGPEAGSLEVKLQLKSRRFVIAKCTPCGTMEFDPNQVNLITTKYSPCSVSDVLHAIILLKIYKINVHLIVT